MKRILLPVDTMELSEKTMEMARDLAESFGSDVLILHVQPDLTASMSPHLAIGFDFDGFREMSEQIVDNARKRFDGSGVHAVTTHIREGNPASAIVEFSESERCDLIIMSTHSTSAVKQFLLGSVTSKVVCHAHIPVLVVR